MKPLDLAETDSLELNNQTTSISEKYTPDEIRHNFRLGSINGILYTFADSILDPTLVLVAFLSNLTQSPILLGLIVPIRQAAWSLPQLWVSGYIQNMPRKMVAYRQMAWIRIAWWGILALSINLIQDPTWLLITFFVSFTISSLANGVGGLPFLEVIGKTIPPNRRGEMYAWRLGVGGALGIGGSVFVRWILSANSPFQYPRNYGILAIIFFGVASVSLVIFNRAVEYPDQHLQPRRNFWAQIKRGITILGREKNYRNLMIALSLLTISSAAIPFYAIFVQQELGGSKDWVGIYLAVIMATNMISNIVFGRQSRNSNQIVLIGAAIAGLLMSLLVFLLVVLAKPLHLTPLAASIWLLPVFILNGIRGTGIGVSSNSLLLNIVPDAERSLMIGFSQTVVGAVMLATGLIGVVVNSLGYPFVMGLTLATHLMGLWSATKIRETVQ